MDGLSGVPRQDSAGRPLQLRPVLPEVHTTQHRQGPAGHTAAAGGQAGATDTRHGLQPVAGARRARLLYVAHRGACGGDVPVCVPCA